MKTMFLPTSNSDWFNPLILVAVDSAAVGGGGGLLFLGEISRIPGGFEKNSPKNEPQGFEKSGISKLTA